MRKYEILMLNSIFFYPIFVPNIRISPLNWHVSPLNVKINKKTEPTTRTDSEFDNYSLGLDAHPTGVHYDIYTYYTGVIATLNTCLQKRFTPYGRVNP